MIKAKELLNMSEGIDKYFFIVSSKYVKVGDTFSCTCEDKHEHDIFEITESSKTRGDSYDLGKCSKLLTPSANDIAYYVDKCGFKVDSIQFYHGPITLLNDVEKVKDCMIIYVKR